MRHFARALAPCLALAVMATGATAAELAGPPKVIDGETLEVAGQRLRLYGVDAPDLRQTCEIRGRTYNCGRVSRTALMDLVAGVDVRCRTRGRKVGDAMLASCQAAGYDLAAGMVHTGWAMAYPREGTTYARIEKQAAKAKRGLWQGAFVPPWEWTPPPAK